jgi:hypothetical protein
VEVGILRCKPRISLLEFKREIKKC